MAVPNQIGSMRQPTMTVADSIIQQFIDELGRQEGMGVVAHKLGLIFLDDRFPAEASVRTVLSAGVNQ